MRKSVYDTLQFEALPQKCKELFFEYCHRCAIENHGNAEIFVEVEGFYIPEECKSPIEKILYFAFSIINFERQGADIPGYLLEPQEEIVANGRRYYADFVFNYYGWNNSDYLLVPAHELKLIVECDGHEFHNSTKAQVKHDNERDFNLKMAGYDVLHYSGSQIFNDPLECANDIHNYITRKTGGWRKVYLEDKDGEI